MLGTFSTKPVVTISPKSSVRDAAWLMRDRNVGAVVIVDGRRPIGILTDRDIVVGVVAADRGPAEVKVDEVMQREPAVIHEDQGIFDAMKMFGAEGIRRLPVVTKQGELVGIVALDDVLVLLGREMGQVASALARARRGPGRGEPAS